MSSHTAWSCAVARNRGRHTRLLRHCEGPRSRLRRARWRCRNESRVPTALHPIAVDAEILQATFGTRPSLLTAAGNRKRWATQRDYETVTTARVLPSQVTMPSTVTSHDAIGSHRLTSKLSVARAASLLRPHPGPSRRTRRSPTLARLVAAACQTCPRGCEGESCRRPRSMRADP